MAWKRVVEVSFDAKLMQVAEIMTRVTGDTSVPRNIRRVASEVREILLKKEDDPIVRASSAVMSLDEISNDPNMPVHTRTTIWNAVSILETIHE